VVAEPAQPEPAADEPAADAVVSEATEAAVSDTVEAVGAAEAVEALEPAAEA
jgi:hypothetical protein